MNKNVEFKNSRGDKLAGILNETNSKDWVLIMAHGFTSNKNTKNFVKLSEMLEGKNISSLRFDFWGHGESDGNFSDITISEAVDDILNAIKFVKELGYKNVGLLGSSFGGISSIMASSKTSDLSFLCLKSPVSNYWEVVEEAMILDIPPKLEPSSTTFLYPNSFTNLIAFKISSTASEIVISEKFPSLSPCPQKSNLKEEMFFPSNISDNLTKFLVFLFEVNP
jgi:alpha/beta superfamily hydrolase